MIRDLRIMFCGESGCSDIAGKPCNSDFLPLIQPNSCINHAVIICLDVLLLVMFLFLMIQKSSERPHNPERFQLFTLLKIAAAVINGCLGLQYLGFGIWILE